MDLSEEKACEDLQSLAANIPVLSDYVKGLESHVKSRYLQKISVVGVDPASILYMSGAPIWRTPHVVNLQVTWVKTKNSFCSSTCRAIMV